MLIKPGANSREKQLAILSFWLLCLGVAGYAGYAYGFLPLGVIVHPDMQLNFNAHKAGIYTHIFASMLALVLCPVQFSARFRSVHRLCGRIYLGLGVALGGLAGLYMSAFAYGGMVTKLGFACLALGWLYTGGCAYTAIRQKNIQQHQNWMIRNVALTLAAVSLRIYLPTAMLARIPFELAYPAIAWLCWLPNLLLAEWLFIRQNPQLNKPQHT